MHGLIKDIFILLGVPISLYTKFDNYIEILVLTLLGRGRWSGDLRHHDASRDKNDLRPAPKEVGLKMNCSNYMLPELTSRHPHMAHFVSQSKKFALHLAIVII